MIEVDEAILKIQENTGRLTEQKIPVKDACGYSLAEDVYSPINMPPFDQSAMDGYAVIANGNSNFKLVGEVKAGDQQMLSIKEGEAIRIFTGAMIPQWADTVIRQEDVERIDNTINVEDGVKKGANIRGKGEQISKGDCAVRKGTHLTPGAIGFLSMLGHVHVLVYAKPKVTVIVTGSELVKPGTKLEMGQIYESNSAMLVAAIGRMGISAELMFVRDDYQHTVEVMDEAVAKSDLVLLTGGISVGDYDFVGDALKELDVKEHFYKVKQKPGKPLFYGTKEGKSIFALPGNPGAVLSCFYVYVLPCIHQLMGRCDENRMQTAKLAAGYKKTAKLTHFLKARLVDGEVEILNGQSSAMLNSFVSANCIAKLESGREEWSEGDQVSVIPVA